MENRNAAHVDGPLLRLATFNIESFGEDRLRPERLEPRIAALRPKLLELEADILCLQEVNAQREAGVSGRKFLALDRLLADTPYAGFSRSFSTREGATSPGDRHNLLVLSRYPALETKIHYRPVNDPPYWQPSQAEPAITSPQPILFDRPILQVDLDAGFDRPLHVFVVHLRAPIAAPIPGGKSSPSSWRSVPAWAEGYFLASIKRAAQALDLRLMIDRLLDADPEALIAIAGDFNTTGDGSALRLLLADPDDTGNADLAGRRLHQLDAALPRELRRTVIHKGRGQALDHVLASPGLASRFKGVDVFNEDLADEFLDAGTSAEAGSFHAAVRATFEL